MAQPWELVDSPTPAVRMPCRERYPVRGDFTSAAQALPPPRTTWAKSATCVYSVLQSKSPLPRSSALSQWTRWKEMEMIENRQNKADCSGVCRFQIRAYDKKAGGRARALMAAETSGTST